MQPFFFSFRITKKLHKVVRKINMKKISQICMKTSFESFWRPTIVIVALLALMLFFSCCKKKKVDPIPPTPTCQTGAVLFAGKYEHISAKKTFTIEFLNNNCPTENSNTYIIKGFGEAVKSYSVANKPLFTANDYTITSDEPNFNAHNYDEGIQLLISKNIVSVTSPRLKGTIQFIK